MTDKPHAAFAVDDELEAEFQKALQHQLTDEDIEKSKLLLGIDMATVVHVRERS